MAGLAGTIVLVCLASLMSGALGVSPGTVLSVLSERVGVGDGSSDTVQTAVVVDIRLPRILLGLLVGAALGVAGSCLQGVFRNPLADAGLIGVSTGAAFGAVLAIVLNLSFLGRWTVPFASFVAAMATIVLVYGLARSHGRTDRLVLVLTGIAVNAIVAAAIGVLILRADDAQLRSITFWQLGSLGGGTWPTLKVAAPVLLPALALAPRFGRPLDVLALGDREAAHLGLRPERLRLALIALSAVLAGTSVALVGIVGFIGLVVPHVIRLIAGPAHGVGLVGSALGGALLLTAADLAARTVASPNEVPIGIVTGACGGIFFLALLLQLRRARPA